MDSRKNEQQEAAQGFADFLREAEEETQQEEGLLSLEALSEAYSETIERGDASVSSQSHDKNDQQSADFKDDAECEEKEFLEEGGDTTEEGAEKYREDAGDHSKKAYVAGEDWSRFADEDDEGCATDDDLVEVTPLTILEAILFVGTEDERPLSSAMIAHGLRGVDSLEIDDLIRQLNDIYDHEGRPYRIGLEGAGYRMMLREEFEPLREKFYGRVREARLSQAAIDTLAIIAYRQGVTREVVDKIRDKPSSTLLNQLVRRGLVRIERDPEQPRVLHYYTTERFLQLFNLEAIGDLPQSIDSDSSLY